MSEKWFVTLDNSKCPYLRTIDKCSNKAHPEHNILKRPKCNRDKCPIIIKDKE